RSTALWEQPSPQPFHMHCLPWFSMRSTPKHEKSLSCSSALYFLPCRTADERNLHFGAHHPTRFSNTHRFYKRGRRGINIDPNPDGLAAFRRRRKRDINLQYGVADCEGELVYYMFNEPALNSFDRVLSEQRETGKYQIVGKVNVPVKR